MYLVMLCLWHNDWPDIMIGIICFWLNDCHIQLAGSLLTIFLFLVLHIQVLMSVFQECVCGHFPFLSFCFQSVPVWCVCAYPLQHLLVWFSMFLCDIDGSVIKQDVMVLKRCHGATLFIPACGFCVCLFVCLCLTSFVWHCVSKCMCVCVRRFACVRVCACTCMRICMWVLRYSCTCVCSHTCVFSYLCLTAFMCVCLFTCICLCVCARACVCTGKPVPEQGFERVSAHHSDLAMWVPNFVIFGLPSILISCLCCANPFCPCSDTRPTNLFCFTCEFRAVKNGRIEMTTVFTIFGGMMFIMIGQCVRACAI